MGVVGSQEALQDAAAGGRGPAPRHDEVLEAHRQAEQRRQPPERGRARLPRRAEAPVGSGGGLQGTLVVERDPGMQGAVLAVRQVEVGLDELS